MLPPLACQLEKFSVCVMENRYLLLSGGTNGSHLSSDKVFKLDLELQKWTEEPCLNQARFNHASYAIGNIPYVYGGEDFCGNYLNTIEHLKEQEKSSWFGFNVTK